MSRRRKVVLTIIPALLLFGVLLLAACDQEAALPSGGNNQSGDNGDHATSSPMNPPPVWEGEPWSNPEDYEYYYNILPISGSDIEVKKVLRHQIIPQAVKSLLATFPKTFGYLEDWAIGFGLEFYDMGSDNNGTEAFFELGAGFGADASKAADATYEMKIDSTSTSLNAYQDGVLSAGNRPSLEILCIHELMHAMMYETLTCGMSGFDVQGNDTTPFPNWFKEGTAEAACGSRLSQIIKVDDDIEQITGVLKQQALTGKSTTSGYTAGWFELPSCI